MADFLTTSATTSCIEQLLSTSKRRVVLMSPFLKLSQIMFERLMDADRRSVEIAVVYGKEDLRAEQHRLLRQLVNMRLYFYENLHAKCYFNESQLIVSSMNLHEFSERTNREMSIRVWAADRVYRDAVAEAESIIQAATLDRGVSASASPVNPPVRGGEARASGSALGHCIRCDRPIPKNKERPFCLDCFVIWAGWEDWDYGEAFCHACGTATRTSRRRPLCQRCFELPG
jgi:hypothetical protein